MVSLCETILAQSFWRRQYNIGYQYPDHLGEANNGAMVVLNDNRMSKLDLATGDDLWHDLSLLGSYGAIAPLPLADGDVLHIAAIFGGGTGVQRISADGQITWTAKSDSCDFYCATGLSKGDVVVGAYLYAESQIHRLTCFDGAGIIRWHKDFPYSFNHLFSLCSDTIVAVATDHIVTLSPEGQVYGERSESGCYFTDTKMTNRHFFGMASDTLVCISSTGGILWQKTMEYETEQLSIFVLRASRDKDILISGTIRGSGAWYFAKVDLTGNISWLSKVPSYAYQTMYSYVDPHSYDGPNFVETQNGAFFVSGRYAKDSIAMNSGFTAKGVLQWQSFCSKKVASSRGTLSAAPNNTVIDAVSGASALFVTSLIPDQTVNTDEAFTFQIPCAAGVPYTFTKIAAPSAMAVSAAGLISWTPLTDSNYIEHVEYAVIRSGGTSDTLSFNIHVNGYLIEPELQPTDPPEDPDNPPTEENVPAKHGWCGSGAGVALLVPVVLRRRRLIGPWGRRKKTEAGR
jgi:hypothetical protein